MMQMNSTIAFDLSQLEYSSTQSGRSFQDWKFGNFDERPHVVRVEGDSISIDSIKQRTTNNDLARELYRL